MGVRLPLSELLMMKLFRRVRYLSIIPLSTNTICVDVSLNILLLYSGKCLSISDAIGRRLRDGDKIRYKVRPDTRLFCFLHILLSVEADAKIDTRITRDTKDKAP